MKKKNLETLAAGMASMNLGTASTVDVMNEPGGAALAALNLKPEDRTEALPDPPAEDPRKR